MNRYRSGAHGQPKDSDVLQVSFRKGDSICNLCRLKANLTYDHIPPRCCGNDKEVLTRRIYADEMIAQQFDVRAKGGLKYRTLCKTCNGDAVGSTRDEALGEFSKLVEPIAAPSLILPAQMTFNIRPGAVLRSILGHFIAAKTEDDEVPFDQKIRDYLLGRAPLDPAIKVYCWLYPFRPIVVSRDFTFVEVEGDGGKSPGLVSVIKYYPLAFCVLDGEGNLNANCVAELHGFAGSPDDARADIALWRLPVVQPGWPERAMGNHVVLGGRTYGDSVTTVAPGGGSVTFGKQVQAAVWPSGDASGLLNGLHAFAEIPKS